jgi:DtxR family Mn-dependent transcriptional regulator
MRTMASVTVAEEEYLQTLFWLYEAGLPMTAANLARAMQLSAPTVHEMVRRLERDGYITRAEDKAISFTPDGQREAEEVVSRHRLIERFLTDIVGVPWDDVHEEAEKLEHAMSPRFEAYVRSAVAGAETCPHGHPIAVGQRLPGVPLADCEVGARVKVLRFENEAEDLLHYLKDAGLDPGLEGEVADSDEDHVHVRFDNGAEATITRSVAETVTVQADPSPPPRTALPEQLVIGRERYGR